MTAGMAVCVYRRTLLLVWYRASCDPWRCSRRSRADALL